MGLLSRLFGRRDEIRQSPVNPVAAGFPLGSDVVGIFSTGGYQDTGVAVNEMTALTAAAVYSCVAVISQAIAALPAHVKRKQDGGKVLDHPLARLLGSEPNEYQSAPDFRENMTLQLLLWGNCYAYIERDELGVATALLPLRSDRTIPVRFNGGRLQYQTQIGGALDYLDPQDVLHVHNMSLDGITGLSPIQQARQSVGLSLALERFAAKFFGQGCHAGGVLTVPSLKSEGIQTFAKNFREKYTGPENSWKVAVLEKDMTYTPTTIDPEKSQALEQRVHQILEICRIYRCPPHKIMELSRSTYSNIEHQAMEFVTDCLMPWVVKWEAELERKLFLEREKPDLELKFNLDSMLRGDTKTRYDAHNVAIQAGFKTPNECRADEGLPPIEGGDVLRFPLNSAPVGQPAPTPPADTPAVRGLIVDSATRLLTKESKALIRAAKKHAGKPAELRQWADAFYADHAKLVTRVMAAPIKAAAIATTAAEYARTHCAESIRAITAVVDGANVDDLTDEWTELRSSEIADHLLEKK